VSIQDSSISGDGNGSAGVVAGESGSLGKSRDTSVIRCRISGFRNFGVTFSHLAHGVPDAALHAVAIDNNISDVNDPSTANGTNEGAIWSGGVEAAIIGNKIARTGWDGIETVGTSTNVSVIRNQITDTITGIYIEHATTGSLIANNQLGRVETGINVEWTYGGIGSVENKFVGNNIYSVGKYGIFLDVGSDRNHVLSNQFLVGDKPAIILQGSSKNLIRGNRLCAVKNQLVKEQVGRWDSGALAYPNENTIVGNRVGVTCRRGSSG
jgi:hypothetical protein